MENPQASDGVLNSEVARLVSGYLTSSGCSRTRAVFVEEHEDLSEFSGLVRRGLLRSVDSTLDGMTLIDIIEEYTR